MIILVAAGDAQGLLFSDQASLLMRPKEPRGVPGIGHMHGKYRTYYIISLDPPSES